MRFLYKIHSGYDGFTPSRIPYRVEQGKILRLGWARYIDVVEKWSEVWVYFHGPHKFKNGVYIKGIVEAIRPEAQAVYIRIRESSTGEPLTDAEASARIAEIVDTRYRQVFLLPEQWAVAAHCQVASLAESCKKRKCETCATWRSLPLIEEAACGWPARLPRQFSMFVPAFWVIPRICALRTFVGPSVRHTTDLFYRYKLGEEALAFPLALGIYESLRRRGELDFDCIVPIPLSPDKATAGEVHRTLLLAKELSRLLIAPVEEMLCLTRPISKRRLRAAGYTAPQFEARYYGTLSVRTGIPSPNRILLVDDVCTEGSTLRCAGRRIQQDYPNCHMIAATAGQMIVKAVVKDLYSIAR